MNLGAEHARVLCGAPWRNHHDLVGADERLMEDLADADLVELIDDGHECDCEFCDQNQQAEWVLTCAGEAARDMLLAAPAGVEIKGTRPTLRLVGGAAA